MISVCSDASVLVNRPGRYSPPRDVVERRRGAEAEQPVDGVAVDVERGDAGRRDDDHIAVGVGHEVADQRRLAGARLAGQEDMPAAGQQLQRVAELVGEDEPVGNPRHALRRYSWTIDRRAREPTSINQRRNNVESRIASVHHDASMLGLNMRTTVDLPDDLHKQALAIARDTRRTLSQTVADLIRRGLGTGEPAAVSVDSRTGLPVVSVGRVVTSEDVRSLADEE